MPNEYISQVNSGLRDTIIIAESSKVLEINKEKNIGISKLVFIRELRNTNVILQFNSIHYDTISEGIYEVYISKSKRGVKLCRPVSNNLNFVGILDFYPLSEAKYYQTIRIDISKFLATRDYKLIKDDELYVIIKFSGNKLENNKELPHISNFICDSIKLLQH